MHVSEGSMTYLTNFVSVRGEIWNLHSGQENMYCGLHVPDIVFFINRNRKKSAKIKKKKSYIEIG